MKTVALIANLTWTISNYRRPLIRALQANGYQVIAIAAVDESFGDLRNEPGLEIIPLKHLARNNTNVWSNLQSLRELAAILRQKKPDLVLTFGVQANILGPLAAAPMKTRVAAVVTGIGYGMLHKGWLHLAVSLAYRIALRFVDLVFFENRDDQALFVRRRLVAARKTRHVPGCGIDTTYFSPVEKPGTDNHKVVFSFIGRLLYDKGLKEYAQAAQALHNNKILCECLILGKLDPENPSHISRKELVAWTENPRLVYKGYYADIRPWIAASDWIVLPSYREGLSRVLLEGMSMGKPVIATDVPGCRELVEEGTNGFLVVSGDANSLAAAMEKACATPEALRNEMGKNGRAKAKEEFSAEIVCMSYLNEINQLLS